MSASSAHEHDRLTSQADWYAAFTRRLLASAGLTSGMRVLDVGCGPGDVSFLAAELVGAHGSVLGVERDEAAVAAARARVADQGVANIEFRVGDFRDLDGVDGLFDAVVGRLVLMYQADPAAAVAAVARHVRPGGIVAFAEMCLTHGLVDPSRALICWPPTSAWCELSTWVHDMHMRLGTQACMGYRLPETFERAGLPPATRLDGELVLAVGEDAISRTVELARSFVPMIVQTGVATETDVDIDTLAERLRADTGATGPIVSWPPVVGAYTRTSG